MKYFLVTNPLARGTTLPQFYYLFAKDEEDAIHKVSLKWGEFNNKMKAKEINEEDFHKLIIATNYFG